MYIYTYIYIYIGYRCPGCGSEFATLKVNICIYTYQMHVYICREYKLFIFELLISMYVVCINVYVHTYEYVFVYVYIYMYTYMYIYINFGHLSLGCSVISVSFIIYMLTLLCLWLVGIFV
jgi:hypothetical protein